MTFLVRYLEIFTTFSLQAKCFHDIFSLHFHYISRHFHDRFSLQINFHDILSLHFHYKFSRQRDEQTGTNRLHGDTQTDFHYNFHSIFTTFSRQSYHRAANLHIFTTFSRHFHDNLIMSMLICISYHGLLICIFSLHFHYIFTTILSRAANLNIFTTIFTTFSLHFHDNLITGC